MKARLLLPYGFVISFLTWLIATVQTISAILTPSPIRRFASLWMFLSSFHCPFFKWCVWWMWRLRSVWISNSFISVDLAIHSQFHRGVYTLTDAHRHGEVVAISKVIEFVTFGPITSVCDKTLLHDTAACVCVRVFVRHTKLFYHLHLFSRQMSATFTAAYDRDVGDMQLFSV